MQSVCKWGQWVKTLNFAWNFTRKSVSFLKSFSCHAMIIILILFFSVCYWFSLNQLDLVLPIIKWLNMMFQNFGGWSLICIIWRCLSWARVLKLYLFFFFFAELLNFFLLFKFKFMSYFSFLEINFSLRIPLISLFFLVFFLSR